MKVILVNVKIPIKIKTLVNVAFFMKNISKAPNTKF
jgi:hypothetical protein